MVGVAVAMVETAAIVIAGLLLHEAAHAAGASVKGDLLSAGVVVRGESGYNRYVPTAAVVRHDGEPFSLPFYSPLAWAVPYCSLVFVVNMEYLPTNRVTTAANLILLTPILLWFLSDYPYKKGWINPFEGGHYIPLFTFREVSEP